MVCEIERDAPLTFMERILGVIAALSPFIGVTLVSILVSGCINCVVRSSLSKPCITEVYQPTRMAAGYAIITAWPQMVSDAPGHSGFGPINILSIPLSILILGDAACEAALDTVFLPYDIFQSSPEPCSDAGIDGI